MIPDQFFQTSKVLVLTVGCINYDHDINHFEPISKLFPKTLRYDYFTRSREIGRDAMNVELLQLVSEEVPDFIFYITYQNQVKLDTLTRMSATGSKLIGWFSDDQWRFDSFSKNLAKYLDYQVTTDSHAFIRYQQSGFSSIHCQWGSNPSRYVRKTDLPLKYDVSFVGARHGQRRSILDQFVAQGLHISGFGRDWQGRISFVEMIDIFNQSSINLNFSGASVDDSIRQIKGRHFEIPMCGGFLLTDYVKGIEDYFIPGEEIEVFHDIDEAIEKINYYLAHEDARKHVAEAGYRRALHEHTWEKRLSSVFSAVFEMESLPANRLRPNFLTKTVNRLLGS